MQCGALLAAVYLPVSGAWTVDAYSRAAPYPRGTVVAQVAMADLTEDIP